ncbi:MAG: hypothetical protein QOH31_1844 [Verrucomicrobiota bacterium]
MTYRRNICLILMFLLSLAPLGTAHTAYTTAYTTAYNYVVTFYPRWFTFIQSAIGAANRLIGPDRISPLYHAVVAINDDTLYASGYISITLDEPVIVSMPYTTDNYSVLQLDQYGDVFEGIPGNTPGLFALVPVNWNGTLPHGVTQIVHIPYEHSVLIVRADKYVKDQNGNYHNMRAEADRFRRHIGIATLSEFLSNQITPSMIVPELLFSVPYKAIAVHMIDTEPLSFLYLLRSSVLSPNTEQLTPDELALSDAFNQFFSDPANYSQMTAAAQAAHADIDTDYLTKTIAGTTWIHFTNIGEWLNPPQYLDRSAVTDYIQYGNNIQAAGYYHSFNAADGNPLDGSAHSYILKFSKNQIPDVSRFWSVTAYLPLGIELVPNSADKYVVASYTPGLVQAKDGSITIYMSVTKPKAVPQANWLPIPPGPFNIMLRAYGPGPDIVNNTYVPPPILPPLVGD